MKRFRFPILLLTGALLLGILVFLSTSLKSGTKHLVTIGKAPKFSFINQYGKTISDKDYVGKIYVVDFFFTSCPSICPIMTENLLKVQRAFTKDQIALASFSIDSERDTPKILKEYADNQGISLINWNLLTGDSDVIFNLANNGFNIYVNQAGEDVGGFEHSGRVALIDANGNIVSRKDEHGNPIVYYDGLSSEGIEQLIEDISYLISR